MFNKKILSGILCAALLFSNAAAAKTTFSDVEDVPGVAWAKDSINEMAELGYIKGYEDGTFQPNKTISKTEALLLISRMLGVNSADYIDSVEYALADFESVLDDYNTSYPEEISFLLYTGILNSSDLDNYISSTNKNAPLKRYEAAILLTKLMGAEKEVTSNAFTSLTYADNDEIPESARPYVEYVKEQGIMQGMGNNAEGQPEFWPNSPVTRSQMAKMLCTLIDVLDVTTETGVISQTDWFNDTITISVDGKETKHPISDNTTYKISGENVEFTDIAPGMTVKTTYIAGKLALVENYVTLEDTVLYGLVSGTRTTDATNSITIADANDTTIVETYVLAKDAKIKVNGAIDLFSKIKKNNYVSVKIEDGLVTELSVIDKNSTTSGTLEEIDATGEYTILYISDKSGKTTPYEISIEGVQVTRNDLDSNLASLMQGDSVTVKMTYGKITKLIATSKNQNLSGKIESITHSTTGTTLKIESAGKTNEYKVNKSVSVVINSSDEGTVYDLRPGTDVSITIESSEILSIKAAGKVEKSQLTGTIVNINATYGLMVIEEDGVEYNVFCNGSTKIIDSITAKTITLKNIEKGRTATVTGSNAAGVLEATAIVLQ